MAVLNANYMRARLAGDLPARAYRGLCMHECVFTDKGLEPHGVKTLDVAKRLLDYGFHAPTIYFPLVVSGALMIEPTETESKETLDAFIDAMDAHRARGARDARTLLHDAPTLHARSAASTKPAPPAARCCAGGRRAANSAKTRNSGRTARGPSIAAEQRCAAAIARGSQSWNSVA